MSGKLIDKFGVKPVLGFGFATAVIGSLFATFVACPHPNALTIVVSLVLIGLGMGFTMGTPLNYMMLQKTDDSESNSALATLSLVRSIGTAVAPAIMVAFVANAGVGMQSAIAEALPKDVEVSALPYAQQIDDELAAMKDDASFASMLEGVDVPKLADYGHIEIGMGQKDADDPASDVQPSADALDALEHSDVVTVVDATKVMAGDMFDQMSPAMQAQAKEGIDAGIEPMRDALERMDAALAAMSANPQAAEAVAQSRAALYTLVEQLTAARDGVPALFDEAKANYLASIDDHASDIQRAYQKQLNIGFAGMFGFVAVCCALGFALTMLYRDSSRSAGAAVKRKRAENKKRPREAGPGENCRSLRKEQLGERHRIDVLAVFVHAHVARGDLVDEDDVALGVVAELELNVVEDKALLRQIVRDDLRDLLSHVLELVVLLLGHDAQNHQAVLGDQRIAQLVVFEGGLDVGGQIGASSTYCL